MDSLKAYCPSCWVEIDPKNSDCPTCGFRMAAFVALGYEGKLLLALKHPVPENRILAIQLLGELKSRSAVWAFETLLDEEEDPYILMAIACALGRIGGDAARALLSRLIAHPSVLVRQTAEDVRFVLSDGAGEDHS